jgi:hypothetical protein
MADDNRVFRDMCSRIKHNQEQRFALMRDWYCELPADRKSALKAWIEQLAPLEQQSPDRSSIRVTLDVRGVTMVERPLVLKLAFASWDKGQPFVNQSIRV